MKRTPLLLFLVMSTSILDAVPEGSLVNDYTMLIQPYVQANAVVGEIRMPDGATLKYQTIGNPEGSRVLVFLGGHTESFAKYAELFYDLRDSGLTIYALDQRGQGYSTRMLPDREKDYIDDYHTYLSDLERFLSEVVRPSADRTIILLGHSLGGGVAAAYAERHPDQVSALVLSCPYLGSAASPFALRVVQLLDALGGAKAYVPGGGPFAVGTFEKNKETHSRARFDRKMQDYADAPVLRLGYPTNHWMAEMEKLGKETRKNAASIRCPTLVFQAEQDAYANLAAQDDFCAHAPGCEKVLLAGAYHEVLIEADGIRDVVLSKIRSFIDANRP